MEIDSLAVQVYDIRKFLFDNTSLISTTKTMFVVFFDGRLYVLSIAPQGWVVWAANHFSDLHAFTFHKLINNYFRYPHVGLRYFEPLPIAASAVGENRLLEHKKPPIITNMKIDAFQVLPDDYNNWSSTVIFFQENSDDDDIHVLAFNSDDCLVYSVLNYQRPNVVLRRVGYAAGDFKLYFVGNIIFDQDLDDGPQPENSLHVDVYDIRTKRWITDDFPMLNARKPKPFVFFLDRRLYVLSTECSPYLEEAPFEMLDINNLSQGWVSLPEPSFAWDYAFGFLNSRMIDYPEKMLYIKSCSGGLLYGYSVHDNRWHELDPCMSTLTGRMGNLFKTGGCSNDCLIVEKYFYSFDVLEYHDGRRATLTITDLEHDTHHDDDPPSWQVDVSSVVPPDVLRDLDACGCLVYIGKRNSRQRFSLIISYRESGLAFHLCTCTFDLRRIGEDVTVSFLFDAICCCHYRHITISEHVVSCHKLSEVKE